MKKKIEKIPDDKKYYEESEFVEEVISSLGIAEISTISARLLQCTEDTTNSSTKKVMLISRREHALSNF